LTRGKSAERVARRPQRANRQEDVAVRFLSRTLLSVALGLSVAHSLPAQQPSALGLESDRSVAPQLEISPNQQIANTIVANLRQSGQLRQYTIDVSVDAGTATLTGNVADQPQREEALRIVQGVPGVERVLDHLTMGNSIAQVQAGAKPPPLKDLAPGQAPAFPPEPTPIFQAPAPTPYDLNPPRMPPYAWPTYAPYNNYSRVAYPEAYPYNAWPFIGPCYPFPKVPLGWRSVKLQWEDGHWWFRQTATGHDWWHLRYW
jgi:hypothetical protein